MNEAKDVLISISSLDEELKKRREKTLIPCYTATEREVLDQWMAMLTVGYIREKIMDSRLYHETSCVLVETPVSYEGDILQGMRSPNYDIRASRLFYDRIDPYEMSVKQHIESLIDSKELMLFYSNDRRFLKISLSWNPISLMLPRFVVECPWASLLFVPTLILMAYMFWAIVTGKKS